MGDGRREMGDGRDRLSCLAAWQPVWIADFRGLKDYADYPPPHRRCVLVRLLSCLPAAIICRDRSVPHLYQLIHFFSHLDALIPPAQAS